MLGCCCSPATCTKTLNISYRPWGCSVDDRPTGLVITGPGGYSNSVPWPSGSSSFSVSITGQAGTYTVVATRPDGSTDTTTFTLSCTGSNPPPIEYDPKNWWADVIVQQMGPIPILNFAVSCTGSTGGCTIPGDDATTCRLTFLNDNPYSSTLTKVLTVTGPCYRTYTSTIGPGSVFGCPPTTIQMFPCTSLTTTYPGCEGCAGTTGTLMGEPIGGGSSMPTDPEAVREMMEEMGLEGAATPPGLFSRAVAFGKAVAAHVADGGRKASPEVQAERERICLGCENQVDNARGCNACGCGVDGAFSFVGLDMFEARSWASKRCPLREPKWDKV